MRRPEAELPITSQQPVSGTAAALHARQMLTASPRPREGTRLGKPGPRAWRLQSSCQVPRPPFNGAGRGQARCLGPKAACSPCPPFYKHLGPRHWGKQTAPLNLTPCHRRPFLSPLHGFIFMDKTRFPHFSLSSGERGFYQSA